MKLVIHVSPERMKALEEKQDTVEFVRVGGMSDDDLIEYGRVWARSNKEDIVMLVEEVTT